MLQIVQYLKTIVSYLLYDFLVVWNGPIVPIAFNPTWAEAEFCKLTSKSVAFFRIHILDFFSSVRIKY